MACLAWDWLVWWLGYGLAWVPGWQGNRRRPLSSAQSPALSRAGGGWWAPWPQIAVGNTNSLVFKDLSGGGCNFPHGPSKHVSRPHVRAQLLLPLRANHNVGGGRGGEHGGSKPPPPWPGNPSLDTRCSLLERERLTPWERESPPCSPALQVCQAGQGRAGPGRTGSRQERRWVMVNLQAWHSSGGPRTSVSVQL